MQDRIARDINFIWGQQSLIRDDTPSY